MAVDLCSKCCEKVYEMPGGWGSNLRVAEGRARSLDLCPACNASNEARVAAAWQALEDERAG